MASNTDTFTTDKLPEVTISTNVMKCVRVASFFSTLLIKMFSHLWIQFRRNRLRSMSTSSALTLTLTFDTLKELDSCENVKDFRQLGFYENLFSFTFWSFHRNQHYLVEIGLFFRYIYWGIRLSQILLKICNCKGLCQNLIFFKQNFSLWYISKC